MSSPHCGQGSRPHSVVSFFFNDTATTEIYTLSLHDALPIFLDDLGVHAALQREPLVGIPFVMRGPVPCREDRKSTRLNSSHSQISYAVFCLKNNRHVPPSTGRSLPNRRPCWTPPAVDRTLTA